LFDDCEISAATKPTGSPAAANLRRLSLCGVDF
jgi:hypothetical protein